MTTPGKINVESANDGEVEDVNGEQLQTALDGSEYALLTYLARALVSEGHDELRVAVQDDSSGTKTVSIEGDDDDGNTLSVAVETLSEAITDPDGLITYLARALQTQGSVDQVRVDLENNNAGTLAVEQQTPVALEDDGGTAISTSNPLSVDAPNTLPVEQQTPVGVEDTSGTQQDPATAQRQGNWATVNHGQDSVTTAGTSVQLNGGTSLAIPDGAALAVRADGSNAGNIYIGDSSVTASNGFVLGAGESATLQVDDVSDVHLDADNDGEGVSWIVEST